MVKIIATIEVDEDTIKNISNTDNLNDAINAELGWLNNSGMSVTDWQYDESEESDNV